MTSFISQPVLKPMIKYRGGKTKELAQILEWVPDDYENYIEPFLGGGLCFLHLHLKKQSLTI